MSLLPTTNANGLPIIPMTDAQKYLFDVRGWLVIPGLLSASELEPIRAHMMAYLYNRDSLPLHLQDPFGGPGEILLDHPGIAGVLTEILSHPQLAAEDCYGFRYDHTGLSHRKAGFDNFSPHGGGGYFNLIGNSHFYQMLPGRVHAGLTRVAFELNEIGPGDGGTMFLSGSHKAAYPRPAEISGRESDVWDTYTCPAGSAVIFTEAICHTGTRWTNAERDRLTLFSCYCAVNEKWSKGGYPNREVIAAMAPKRKTLYRGIWCGGGPSPASNLYYDEHNEALNPYVSG